MRLSSTNRGRAMEMRKEMGVCLVLLVIFGSIDQGRCIGTCNGVRSCVSRSGRYIAVAIAYYTYIRIDPHKRPSSALCP